jgi:hypothetical protein
MYKSYFRINPFNYIQYPNLWTSCGKKQISAPSQNIDVDMEIHIDIDMGMDTDVDTDMDKDTDTDGDTGTQTWTRTCRKEIINIEYQDPILG